ncbi:hypothetical protein EOD42_16930 [Rhodovarius crocodyli]|uniref:DUF2793 domain-containing protein n=1 Tax=Rhodovarius crocodyli TaxID=1979269 RepID=A0A437MCB0_9PROT|nr:hypothetical protein [Rhodovarius crocodyli]RVT95268.1 hypothetical protein EOD42_16930 [Rhodovarius crocodyli]
MKITVVPLPAGVVTLLCADAVRNYLTVVNIDVNDASMSDSSSVTAGSGWPLPAASNAGGQGGGYEWSASQTPRGALYGISTVGTRICVMEG